MGERVSSVSLEPGLFVLRYLRSNSEHGAPTVMVRPAPGSEQIVEVVTPPGFKTGAMDAPGACVVIRAEAAGSLQVTVRSPHGAAEDEAELRLELLSGSAVEARGVSSQVGTAAPVLELLGHVSRRGDVKASGDQWIAGPDAPAPIEGVQAHLLPSSAGVEIEYQALIGGAGGSWTNWMRAGQYAGTRGQFRPLMGLRLRLIGEGVNSFELTAGALFLGASVQSARGQQVELLSASGVDPLVGLKIALKNLASSSEPASRAGSRESVQSPRPKTGRVRVFRASGAR